ncbi:MAG TPA: hypothetical protein VFV73_39870 [Streptosporangiaceae bacterium]|nr:hypothetical protein [Streptosporangiaceae bacterium]
MCSWLLTPRSSASRCTGLPGGITSRSWAPWAAARRWTASRRRREAQSQNDVAVKSAMTTVAPETNAA